MAYLYCQKCKTTVPFAGDVSQTPPELMPHCCGADPMVKVGNDYLAVSDIKCYSCKVQKDERHHWSCRDRTAFLDQAAWVRGFKKGREGTSLGRDAENSPAYRAGWLEGDIAHDEAYNTSQDERWGGF